MGDLYSKNGVTTAADTDTVLLSEDRNEKINQIDHQNIENQLNLFSNT